MSEQNTKKRGLFGKLFGSQPEDAATVEEAKPSADHIEAKGDADEAPAQADSVVDGQEPIIPTETLRTEADAQAESRSNDDVTASTVDQKPKSKSWFSRLTSGLTKTSTRLSQGITGLFNQQKLDEDTLDDFEDILIQADLGVETAMRIRDTISKGRFDKGISAEAVTDILAAEVENVLAPVAQPLSIDPNLKPHIILVVGVNGSGKTTTIGKLAAQYKAAGHEVMIAAGDTFRAAAIDQLKVWGERAGVAVVSRDVGSDAAGLAYDAVKLAQEQSANVLLIDTAGRLQNKQALMEELEKVIRVIAKLAPDAPHDTLLVLDATTGQNAMVQVEAFQSTANVSGLIMTKLDGTARGGILVAIAAKYGLPVHAIGVGEGIEDLQPFDARDFAAAIAGR